MAKKNYAIVHKLTDGIRKIPGLHIVGEPVMGVFAFTSDRHNIFEVGDEMYKRGWTLDRIKYPEALHMVVTNINLDREEAFLNDLEEVVTGLNMVKGISFATKLVRKAAGTIIRAFPGKAQSLFASQAAKAVKSDSPQDQKRGAVFYGISAALESTTDMNEAVVEFLDRLYS